MNNVIDLETLRKKRHNLTKLKKLEENIAELAEIEATLKNVIISLTKYEKYSSIRRRIDDIFYVYQDIKKTASTRSSTLQRLKDELQNSVD